MKRYGSIISVAPDKLDYYKQLHANPWPGVLKTIKECNISNYSIFLHDHLLFGYFEYTGQDYEGDMKKMAQDPVTQQWWAECMPCQIPLDTRKEGEWWADMEEVFHLD